MRPEILPAVDSVSAELRRRLSTLPSDRMLLRWTGKPSRAWDNYSSFVYKALDYQEVVERARDKAAEKQLEPGDFVAYSIVRFFNYLTSRLVETMFLRYPGASAELEGNKFRDIRLFGQPLDIKLTFPPKARTVEALRADFWDPRRLIQGYYEDQSDARFGHQARLFVVLADLDGGNEEMTRWRMKLDHVGLEQLVLHYMDLPVPRLFAPVRFQHAGTDYDTMADIAFLIRNGGRRQVVVYRWRMDGRPSVVWHHHWEKAKLRLPGRADCRPAVASLNAQARTAS